jgi:cellulose biosynthesis protein BcsQ
MQISIMNFKGGQGKTSIALNLAWELDFGIVANETYTVLKNHLDDEHLLIVTDVIPNELDDVIYDFGGGITKHMSSVLKRSDVVIIPFIAEQANVEVTLEAIKSVKELNQNIILVPNKIKEDDKTYNIVLETLKEFGFDSLPIVPIRASTALQNIFNEHKTISKMQKEGGLNSFNFRKINDDFNKLLNLINTYKGK